MLKLRWNLRGPKALIQNQHELIKAEAIKEAKGSKLKQKRQHGHNDFDKENKDLGNILSCPEEIHVKNLMELESPFDCMFSQNARAHRYSNGNLDS